MNVMESLEGQLLIASPQIGDPRFERTVVLIMRHDREGAFGVVLNRPLAETVRSLWEKLGDATCTIDRNINLGGPVSGPIIALHCQQSAAEFEVPPGLYVAEQKKHIKQLVKDAEGPLRIFIGHASWVGGQLEGELASGAWLTLAAKVDHVFHEEDDLWVTAMREVGRDFCQTVLGIENFPPDVTLN